MTWYLIFILLGPERVHAHNFSIHDTMYECFEERERLIEETGRPIIGYQVICVPENNEEEIDI